MNSTHENFARDEKVAGGSERSFAIVMAAALTVLGTVNWWHDGRVWPWLGGIAVGLLILGFFWPAALKPLTQGWLKFGLVLHAIVNPIVMGLIFYLAVWPTGLVLRALGKDPLRLRFEPERDSYWIVRRPPGPAPESMKDQF